MNKSLVIKTIIISILIAGIGAGAFYILESKKTISPISQRSVENKIIAVEKEPSKTLKVYTDSTGFSFKYPQDVQVSKKDTTNDATAYANLEISSSQAKGSISVKILDTELKSIDDWFLENNYTSTKEIKIGELFGKEANMNNKITAAALDQNVLFTIEVASQNKKYWVDVYQTMLSSFNFVSQQAPLSVVSDSYPDDIVLEEETLE